MPLLAQHFLAGIVAPEGAPKSFTPRGREPMQAHHGPGNLHELRNAVQRACAMAAGDQIAGHHAPPAADEESVTLRIGTSMAEAEKALILATFRHYGSHKERTAAALGISLKTLYNRLKEYSD